MPGAGKPGVVEKTIPEPVLTTRTRTVYWTPASANVDGTRLPLGSDPPGATYP